MQNSVFFVALAATLAAGYSTSAQEGGAQDKAPREITIRLRDGDSTGKTLIEINGDKVTVNGKPADDWKGGDVTVRPDWRPFDRGNFAFRSLDGGPRLGVYTVSSDKGAEVIRLADSSAAQQAGLKVGDVITQVDGTKTSGPVELSSAIHDHRPGDKVAIHYLRGGEEHTTTATLGEGKNEFASIYNLRAFDRMPKLDFRAFGQPFNAEWNPFPSPHLGARIQDTEDNDGAKVLQVDPESPAAQSGLQKGDLIKEVDGQKVDGADAVLDALRDHMDQNSHSITVQRDGKDLTFDVKVPRKLKTESF